MPYTPFYFSVTGTSVINGIAPLTVSFQPSNIDFGNNVIGNITYTVSGCAASNGVTTLSSTTTTRSFTYSTLQEALTGSTKGIDSRSDFDVTFYNSEYGQTLNTVEVKVLLIPSLETQTYILSAVIDAPYLTKNPVTGGSDNIFEEVHLIKSRSWGAENNQIIVAEGKNSPGQFLFFKTADQTGVVDTSSLARVYLMYKDSAVPGSVWTHIYPDENIDRPGGIATPWNLDLKIVNNGSIPLTLNPVVTHLYDCSMAPFTDPSSPILPGGSSEFTLSIAKNVTTAANGSVSIGSNDVDSPYAITFTLEFA